MVMQRGKTLNIRNKGARNLRLTGLSLDCKIKQPTVSSSGLVRPPRLNVMTMAVTDKANKSHVSQSKGLKTTRLFPV